MSRQAQLVRRAFHCGQVVEEVVLLDLFRVNLYLGGCYRPGEGYSHVGRVWGNTPRSCLSSLWGDIVGSSSCTRWGLCSAGWLKEPVPGVGEALTVPVHPHLETLLEPAVSTGTSDALVHGALPLVLTRELLVFHDRPPEEGFTGKGEVEGGGGGGQTSHCRRGCRSGSRWRCRCRRDRAPPAGTPKTPTPWEKICLEPRGIRRHLAKDGQRGNGGTEAGTIFEQINEY